MDVPAWIDSFNMFRIDGAFGGKACHFTLRFVHEGVDHCTFGKGKSPEEAWEDALSKAAAHRARR